MQPCPIAAGSPRGTDPRTPQKRTRIAISLEWVPGLRLFLGQEADDGVTVHGKVFPERVLQNDWRHRIDALQPMQQKRRIPAPSSFGGLQSADPIAILLDRCLVAAPRALFRPVASSHAEGLQSCSLADYPGAHARPSCRRSPGADPKLMPIDPPVGCGKRCERPTDTL
mgnify:CR=1 FL=1